MKKDFNFKLIFRFFGILLLVEATALLLTSLVAFYYNEDPRWLLLSGSIALVTGMAAVVSGKNAPPLIGRREGSLIVTMVWVLFSVVGMLPYLFTGSIPAVEDAFFETISGFTTTGASILNNIEALPFSILFWRSLTHWMGGLGIIVMSLAMLPVFGSSGAQLFATESAGPTTDKIHPKVAETAKRLLLIYVTLTVAETVLLRAGGMGWFDAVCHSFGTVATGGFSTKQASVAYWDSAYIHYVIAVFMMLSGVNFSLYYFGFKTKFSKIIENEELKTYLSLLLLFSIVVAVSLIDFTSGFSWSALELAWRNAFFNVTSTITTTGFATVDYMSWSTFTWIILLFAMITGASAGSTSGAMKMVRVVLAAKYCYYEFQKLIHPNAVVPVKYNGKIVQADVITKVLAFVILYLFTIGVGILVLTLSGMPFMESIGGMITCLGGVGPGLGLVGPAGNFAAVPEFSKWFLSFVMLLGRLELFTVLVLFTPTFWKK